MQLTNSYQNQQLVVEISGQFDGNNIVQHREQLEQISQMSGDQLVLDMTKVNSLDSSGLGMLAYLSKRLIVNKTKLILVGLGGQPLTLFKQLGLNKLIPCYQTISEIKAKKSTSSPLTTAILTFGLFVLSGCSSSGWFAVSQQHSGLTGLTTNAESIAHHLQMADNHLAIQRLSGGQECLPASIFEISKTLKQAKQSLQGQRLTDAANRVILAEQQLKHSQKRLSYLRANTACAPLASEPQQQPTDNTQLLAAVDLLLNSNNQFATDKDELTISYQHQLRQAAKLLKQVPQFTIQLTGHADSRGDDNYNIELSKRRSINVSKYLISQGLKPQQIEIKSSGASQPLTEQNNPSAWLANRRVSATLITTKLDGPLKPSKAVKPTEITLQQWWQTLEHPSYLDTSDQLILKVE